jgi:hypothetical protein
VNIHHRLVAAGIAQQSKLIADRHRQSRLNDRKVAYRKNIIAACDPGNKSHDMYLNDLQVMIRE